MNRSWNNLTDALKTSDRDAVEMSFDQVSSLVGDLPTKNMQDPEWWNSGPDKPRTKAWTRAGYSVGSVETSREMVRFKRN
jgi:hypothetical protein